MYIKRKSHGLTKLTNWIIFQNMTSMWRIRVPKISMHRYHWQNFINSSPKKIMKPLMFTGLNLQLHSQLHVTYNYYIRVTYRYFHPVNSKRRISEGESIKVMSYNGMTRDKVFEVIKNYEANPIESRSTDTQSCQSLRKISTVSFPRRIP